MTEKAIRLYEAKGLIHPKTEEKNGRTFREYDDAAIRALLTVGTLRRADFSMEQISAMQKAPARIPEIFEAYRAEVRENAARLGAISRVLSSMDSEGEVNLDDLANRLALAMMREELPTLPAEASDGTEPPVIRFHHYVWDEEGTPEEKEAAYQRFLRKQERRERIEAVLFAVPRRMGAGWRWLADRVNRRIRDENNKVKHTVKLTAAFLVICGVLIGGLVNAQRRFDELQRGCVREIFYAMHDAVHTLRNTVATGTYTHGHSEQLVRSLTVIDCEATMGEYLDHNSFRRWFSAPEGLTDLIEALGSTYCAEHNGVVVESILYDGAVSEAELRFLSELLADSEELYAPMLGEDGLNRRRDLDYGDIRKRLNGFINKWGAWEAYSEAPYDLLNRD